MRFVIKDTNIVDVIHGEVMEHKDLLVEENRIYAIEDTGKLFGDQEMDGRDLLLVPGFVNAHTHLGMSYFRNYADDMELDTWLNEAIWPMEDHLTASDIYWGSLLSMAEEIRSGTTCFCDMYYEMHEVGNAANALGMRGVLTRGLTSGDDEEKKLQEVRELYRNYHKSSNGRLRVVPAPHAIYTCSEHFIQEIFDLAKKLDGIIHMHISETEKEVADCKAQHGGRTPVEYLTDLGMDALHVIAAHCVHMTPEDMNLVNREKFFPVYNPSSNLKLASGFAPVDKMLRRGMIVALGTDGDSSNNNQDMVEEMHIASIVNKAVTKNPEAVSALEVLQMATINGAKALGWDDEIGSIEVGKKADIAMFYLKSPNFTPRNQLISALTYSASSEDVLHVMIDGEFVLKDRKLVNMDLNEIMNTVSVRMEELKKRAGKN